MSSNKNIPAKMHQQRPGAVQITQTQTIHRSGPLPPPEELEYYGRIMPGLIERIVNTADREQEQRHATQTEELALRDKSLQIALKESGTIDKTLNIQSRNSLLGLIFAFLALCVCISGAVYCAYLGYPWTSSIIGLGGLATIVSPFIYGTRIDPHSTKK